MTWTRLSDDWSDRLMDIGLSRSARLMQAEALVYCNRLLLDGRLPRSAVRKITDAEDVAADVAELVAAGLWCETASGWDIDWSDQEDAATVEKRRSLNAARQARFKKHSGGDHSDCIVSYCKVLKAEQSNALVTPLVTHSRPVPSRPLGREGMEPGMDSAGAPSTTGSTGREARADGMCQHGRPRRTLGAGEDRSWACSDCESAHPYLDRMEAGQ